MGATEEEQRGRGEECEPVHKYVCIEGKGIVVASSLPNIVYMNVIYVDI